MRSRPWKYFHFKISFFIFQVPSHENLMLKIESELVFVFRQLFVRQYNSKRKKNIKRKHLENNFRPKIKDKIHSLKLSSTDVRYLL